MREDAARAAVFLSAHPPSATLDRCGVVTERPLSGWKDAHAATARSLPDEPSGRAAAGLEHREDG